MEEMEEKSRVKIAEVIARERKNHNLTQKELGDLLHISPQVVSKWEKELAEPDVETIMKMCEIFGITPNEMYGQPPEESKKDDEDGKASADAQAQSAPTEPVVILGYCEQCKKPLHSTDEYEVYGTRTNARYAKPVSKITATTTSLRNTATMRTKPKSRISSAASSEASG